MGWGNQLVGDPAREARSSRPSTTTLVRECLPASARSASWHFARWAEAAPIRRRYLSGDVHLQLAKKGSTTRKESAVRRRRWARAWLDRPLRVSNQAPHSWQSSSLPPSLSKAAETKHRGAVHGRHLGRPSRTEAGRPGVSLGGPGWWESKTHCCGFMRFGAAESHVPCLGLWHQGECRELKATETVG